MKETPTDPGRSGFNRISTVSVMDGKSSGSLDWKAQEPREKGRLSGVQSFIFQVLEKVSSLLPPSQGLQCWEGGLTLKLLGMRMVLAHFLAVSGTLDLRLFVVLQRGHKGAVRDCNCEDAQGVDFL